MILLFIFQAGFPVGALLKPTFSSQVQSQGTQLYNGGKLLTNDLDSSLANLVGSEFFLHFVFCDIKTFSIQSALYIIS